MKHCCPVQMKRETSVDEHTPVCSARPLTFVPVGALLLPGLAAATAADHSEDGLPALNWSVAQICISRGEGEAGRRCTTGLESSGPVSLQDRDLRSEGTEQAAREQSSASLPEQ